MEGFVIHTDRAFEPETISMLRAVLDDAYDSLPAYLRTQERKTILAERLLNLAAAGETDRIRLRAAALLHVAR
jgi:hypothetical protein